MIVKSDMNVGTFIPIIIFLALQTFGMVWWAADINAKVTILHDTFVRNDMEQKAAVKQLISDIRENDEEIHNTANTVAGMTSSVNSLTASVARLQTSLDKNNALMNSVLLELQRPNGVNNNARD